MILLEVLVVTSVVLIFGEILPKLTAIQNSNKFASIVNLPLRFFMVLLNPVVMIFKGMMDVITYIFPIKKEKIFDTEEELKLVTELGEESGTLQEEESDMIQSIFEFKDKYVREIMTPRVDMISLKTNDSIDTAMDLIREKQYSKIPLYKDNIDDIKGVVYAKDVLPYLTGSRPNIPLIKLARDPYFVPESKRIDDLMKGFRVKKTNVAIVVDEWGGTSGLITLEDIVEEVLGEIRDPYDSDESPIFLQKDDTYIIDARISIYDFQEEFKIEFPEDREYDTLGGFIFHTLGDIPQVEEKVCYKGYTFTVKHLSGNRIAKVHMQ